MSVVLALVLLPALGAAGAAAHRTAAYRTVWLVMIAALHLGLTGYAWAVAPPSALDGWLALDAAGLLALTLVSTVFAATAIYAVGYLRREDPRGGRAFVSCLLTFLAAASLVAESHHFALLWVGLEATTLAVAPLVFHRHDRRSLEAVWKYLMLSSVGIALALLGTFLLAAAQSAHPDTGRPLILGDLVAAAPLLHQGWLKAACVFLFVGFGTKMGLVPVHSWKPDTYGEAPSLVAGLMAGALTGCAFLALTRMTQVMVAAGLGGFLTPLLIGFGVVSLGVAAVLLVVQRDLQRLLAYSSVEHMGLLTLGLGVGGAGPYGAMLHLLTNGVAKSALFLTAGNVRLGGRANDAPGHSGLLHTLPVTGGLLVVGLFAVTGSPPFGTFLSMFTIVRGAFGGGHPWIGGWTLVFLTIAFAGIARALLDLAFGPGPAAGAERARENAWLVAAPVVLMLGLVAVGLYLPPALRLQLSAAAAALGGRAP